MKKILAAFLCVMLVLSCIGCGAQPQETQKPDPSESNSQVSNAPTETQGTPKETVTLKFQSGQSGKKAVLEEIVDTYNNGRGKEKGIYVELVISADNANELEMAQMNNALPDFIMPTNNQNAMWSKTGDIVPLDGASQNYQGVETR